MARNWFINPNEPEQPARGVYRWFCVNGRQVISLYVGNAGGWEQGVSSPSTLKRGVSEAQRNCISSNRGQKLDTDFIVGTAIQYFKAKGFDCYWQHVSDDPSREGELCAEYQPVLQDGTKIKEDFQLRKLDGGLWGNRDCNLAEQKLFEVFEKCFGKKP